MVPWSCGGIKSWSRNERLPFRWGRSACSKAGFISTITPCESQRAAATGACSKKERKSTLRFAAPECSENGNGVAVLMLILCRGRSPERNNKMGCPIPRCSRNGTCADRRYGQSALLSRPHYAGLPHYESHYRRPKVTLRRADVTEVWNNSVENAIRVLDC